MMLTAESLLDEFRTTHIDPNTIGPIVELAAVLAAVQDPQQRDLDEGLGDALAKVFNATGKTVDNLLKKMGLHTHKGKGLLSALTTVSVPVAKVFWVAMKIATAGGMTPELEKELKDATSKINKADWIDLLMRFDTLTFHAVTAPLHMVDAVTGWHVGPDLQAHHAKAHPTTSVVTSAKEAITKAVEDLRNLSAGAAQEVKAKLATFVDSVEKMLGHLPDEKELLKASAAVA